MTPQYQLHELTIEITRKCPMRCTICSSEGGVPESNELTFLELCKIVDDASTLGTKIISLSGGEPLESPYIIDFIRYVKDKGFQLYLYTCGNVEKEKGITSIDADTFRILKELDVDKIIFSIHGPNERIHEKITTTDGSFNNLISSIKLSQKFGHAVELHFVPVLSNFQYLPEVVLLAERLGISKLSVLRFVPQGRGAINRDELEITGNKIHKLKEILQEIYFKSSIEIRLGAPFNCFNIDNKSKCSAGIDKAIIRPDGFVFPCVSMKKIFEITLSNSIRKTPLENIWRLSNIFQKIRLYQESVQQTSCNGCQNYFICQGSCFTQKWLGRQNNSIPNRDPYCSGSKKDDRNYASIIKSDIEGGIVFESIKS